MNRRWSKAGKLKANVPGTIIVIICFCAKKNKNSKKLCKDVFVFLFFGACVLCAGTPVCNSDAVRNDVATLMNVCFFFLCVFMFLVYAAIRLRMKKGAFFFASFVFVTFRKFT